MAQFRRTLQQVDNLLADALDLLRSLEDDIKEVADLATPISEARQLATKIVEYRQALKNN